MRVLMFGWEFPPHNSGGLGVACQHLTKALSSLKAKITFVLPKKMNCQSSFCKMVYADYPGFKVTAVNSLITSPYLDVKSYTKLTRSENNIYSPDLVGEVKRYGEAAAAIAKKGDFDVIHSHDWLSFPAGLKAKEISGKPLVVHVHATEYDRTGGIGGNQQVCEIEKQGVNGADAVIAVSNFTGQKIIDNYGVDPSKVNAVHNAINFDDYQSGTTSRFLLKAKGKKIVLYVGRITIQKGPDYFLDAAKKVFDKRDDVLFIVAGSGDMEAQMIEKAAAMGIADRVLFAGFIRDADLVKAYQMADLYVMPSVSEPFGLTPLESLVYGTPVLITKQSGVSEVLEHALKVDFWDTDEMANKIIAVLEHGVLQKALTNNGLNEVKKFSWNDAAQKCIDIYNQVIIN